MYDTEPLPADHPLLELDSVVTTPHLAGATEEVVDRHSTMILDDIDAVLNGDEPANVANEATFENFELLEYRTHTIMTESTDDERTNRDARAAVCQYGQEMLDKGLTKATGGNVSSRTGPESFAISPSGVPYPEIDPADVPILDIEGTVIDNGKKPSNEDDMHRMVYAARDDVGGIVHTHSPYASTFASLNDPIRPSHYLIAFIGDKVPVAEYVTYGTEELGEKAVEALGEEYNACLLANHGVLAVGDTLSDALETAEMVEYCARIHYQARAIGEPDLLPDEEIAHLEEKFEGYGKNS